MIEGTPLFRRNERDIERDVVGLGFDRMRVRSHRSSVLVIATCPSLVTGLCLEMVQKMDAGSRIVQWLQALFGQLADLEHSLQDGKE